MGWTSEGHGSFSAGAKAFSFFRNVLNGCGVHPFSYQAGTVFFPGVKRSECETDLSRPSGGDVTKPILRIERESYDVTENSIYAKYLFRPTDPVSCKKNNLSKCR
jgi:hypothetical protein